MALDRSSSDGFRDALRSDLRIHRASGSDLDLWMQFGPVGKRAVDAFRSEIGSWAQEVHRARVPGCNGKGKGEHIRIFISMLVSFLVICQDFLVDLAKCTKAKFK